MYNAQTPVKYEVTLPDVRNYRRQVCFWLEACWRKPDTCPYMTERKLWSWFPSVKDELRRGKLCKKKVKMWVCERWYSARRRYSAHWCTSVCRISSFFFCLPAFLFSSCFCIWKVCKIDMKLLLYVISIYIFLLYLSIYLSIISFVHLSSVALSICISIYMLLKSNNIHETIFFLNDICFSLFVPLFAMFLCI